MERIAALVIGYLFGLFQTGYLYGMHNHIDIRKYGSGNAGTTNALRVMGKKAGLIVLLGDAMKAVLAVCLVRYIFRANPNADLFALLAGLGATLGHNFPFYLNFKGGKGIACMAGIIIAFDWRLFIIELVLFVGVVFLTRYVSLGSILVSISFCALISYFAWKGSYILEPKRLTEFILVAVILMLMALERHHANIGRLLSGTENKLHF